MVGALFPAVGGSIGKLDLPEGVTELLGGADYGTLAGWMRSEIGAVYGPLVIGAVGDHGRRRLDRRRGGGGILGLVLAHPIGRSRLILAKAAAVAVERRRRSRSARSPGWSPAWRSAAAASALGHLAALASTSPSSAGDRRRRPRARRGDRPARRSPSGGAAAFAVLGFLSTASRPSSTA